MSKAPGITDRHLQWSKGLYVCDGLLPHGSDWMRHLQRPASAAPAATLSSGGTHTLHSGGEAERPARVPPDSTVERAKPWVHSGFIAGTELLPRENKTPSKSAYAEEEARGLVCRLGLWQIHFRSLGKSQPCGRIGRNMVLLGEGRKYNRFCNPHLVPLQTAVA